MSPLPFLAKLAIEVGIQLLVSLFQQDPPPPPPLQVEPASTDPLAALPIPYGVARCPGQVVYVSTQDSNRVLWVVVAFAHGAIREVRKVYLDGVPMLGADARGALQPANVPRDIRGQVQAWVAYGTDGQVAWEPRPTMPTLSITNSAFVNGNHFRQLTASSVTGVKEGDAYVASGSIPGIPNGSIIQVVSISSTQLNVTVGSNLDGGTAAPTAGCAGTLTPYRPVPGTDVAPGGQWLSTTNGKKVAYLALRLLNQPYWAQQGSAIPRVEVEVDGLAVEDPRTASPLTISSSAVGAGLGGYSASALVTFSAAHGLSEGDLYRVAGHSRTELNGVQRVAEVVSATVVRSYVVLTGAGSGGTATPLVRSGNPIIALRDYFTSTVYGAGQDPATLDAAAITSEADYCDTVVNVPLVPDLDPAVNIISVVHGNPIVYNTATAHGLAIGDVVLMQNVGANSGLQTVATVPSGTSFTLGPPAGGTAAFMGTLPTFGVVQRATRSPAQVNIATSSNPGGGLWKFSCTTAHGLPATALVRIRGHSAAADNVEALATRVNATDFTIPAPVGAATGTGGTMTRLEAIAQFRVDGLCDAKAVPTDNLRRLLQSCRGALVREGSVYRPWIRRAGSPGAVAFTEDDVLSDIDLALPGGSDRANVLRGKYLDPTAGYVPTVAEWPIPGTANQFLTDDNGVLARREVELPMVAHYGRALLLLQVMRREARAAKLLSARLPEAALQTRIGDIAPFTWATPSFSAKSFWIVGLQPDTDRGVTTSMLEYDASAYTIEEWTPPNVVVAGPTAAEALAMPAPLVQVTVEATGTLTISVTADDDAAYVAAAVSTSAFPDASTVDAATGTLQAAGATATLVDSTVYAWGTTVYVSVRAYRGTGEGSALAKVQRTRTSLTANERTGATRAYSALDTNNRLTDQRNARAIIAANLSAAIQGSSPLSVNSSGVITISAFTMQYGFGTVNYNSGSITTGWGAGTTLYVYASDAGLAGGAVSYFASIQQYAPQSSTDYVYLGKVTVPGAGSAGGSGGGGYQ